VCVSQLHLGNHQSCVFAGRTASAFLSAELASSRTRAPIMPVPAPLLVLMKEDSRAIFTAASRAKEAVTFLKRFQPLGISSPLHSHRCAPT
jgi:antirestriction protein ArdC